MGEICASYTEKKEDEEEGRNVLLSDVFNTFYLRSYGVRYMAKDHIDYKRGNPLPQERDVAPW